MTGAAGGVGSVAVALLAKLGYEVIASTGRPEEARLPEGARRRRDHRPRASSPRRQAAGKERWAAGVDSVGSTRSPTSSPRPSPAARSPPAGSPAAWTCRPRSRPSSCAASRCSGSTASWRQSDPDRGLARLARDLDRAKLASLTTTIPFDEVIDREGHHRRQGARPRGGGRSVTAGRHGKFRHGLKTKTPPVAPRRRQLTDPLPESSSWHFGSRLPRRDGRPQNNPEDDGADQRECRPDMAIMLSRCIWAMRSSSAVNIALTLAASLCSASPFVAAAQRCKLFQMLCSPFMGRSCFCLSTPGESRRTTLATWSSEGCGMHPAG